MGTADMSLFLQLPEVQLVALCDPKQPAREQALQAATAAGAGQGVALYGDFRELVDRPDIDVVSVASTDHWHVRARAGRGASRQGHLRGKTAGLQHPADQDAARRGPSLRAHVPVRDAAASMPQFHQACELVLNGRIGKVHTIRVSAPPGFAERTGEPGYPIMPPPDDVDYDMWLGPAPWAPLHAQTHHLAALVPHQLVRLGLHRGLGNPPRRHRTVGQRQPADRARWRSKAPGCFPPNDGLCDTALNWDVDMTYANGVHLSFTSDGGKNRHGIRFEGLGRLDPRGSQPAHCGTRVGPARTYWS